MPFFYSQFAVPSVFLVIMSIIVFTFSNFQFSPQGSDKDRRKDAIEKEKARKV